MAAIYPIVGTYSSTTSQHVYEASATDVTASSTDFIIPANRYQKTTYTREVPQKVVEKEDVWVPPVRYWSRPAPQQTPIRIYLHCKPRQHTMGKPRENIGCKNFRKQHDM